MPVIINAENLIIDDLVRDSIIMRLAKLESILPSETVSRLFLKKDGKGVYRATLSVHFEGEDVVYTEENAEFYPLIASAKAHVMRRVKEIKKRRLAGRRKNPSPAA